jgi:hypothetical protein
MDAPDRPASGYLTFLRRAAEAPRKYSLFALVRGASARALDKPPVGASRLPSQDLIALRQIPHVRFPAPTLENVELQGGKGTVELHARAAADHVEVQIVDDGPGIPEDVRSRIFDPFFTTKPPGIGSGLGLHIVHNIIVNQHHGRLEVDSRPGRTAFTVTLPLRLKPAG